MPCAILNCINKWKKLMMTSVGMDKKSFVVKQK